MAKSRHNRKYRKRTKRHRNRRVRKGGSKNTNIRPIPLPKVPEPIHPVTKIKGGFKTDIVDNLEDRDDDWIITKQ